MDINKKMDSKKIFLMLRIQLAMFAAAPLFLFFVLSQQAKANGFNFSLFNESFYLIVGIVALLNLIPGFSNIVFLNHLAQPNKKLTGLANNVSNYSTDKLNSVGGANILLLTTIISFVFFESCSLLGFIIALRSQNLSMFLPFMGLTYTGLILSFIFINKLKSVVDLEEKIKPQ